MDQQRFDALARALASGRNRRQILKGLLGLTGGVAAIGGSTSVDAARRTPPTPKPVTCPGQQVWDGTACVCSSGTKCGSDCCPDGQATCCDSACCYGVCYGEELCCETVWCETTGECCPDGLVCCGSAGCVDPGTAECCADSDCAVDEVCSPELQCVCREGYLDCGDLGCMSGESVECCSDDHCTGGTCIDQVCCTPSCPPGACGDDGCGGFCGPCPSGQGCSEGQCVTCATCTSMPPACGSNQGPYGCFMLCGNDGTNICIENRSCDSSTVCSTNDDCAEGYLCSHEVCCDTPVCVAPCGASAARVAASTASLSGVLTTAGFIH